MSKINQIQQALLEMDGGEFQKLADAYLVEKGLGHVNSVGSVAAANKVRTGTPDSLLTTPQGYYAFAEHTTQKTNLRDKMSGDLNKCFDESKTGVPVGKIERVVFCFTSKISAADEHELSRICHSKGVKISLYGIDAISFDLYSKYPGLARDFLGVKIDSGQIVQPERFVSLYNNSKLATPLNLRFHFREEELEHLLCALETENLTFLSGKAGVGKSRLALEACRRFNEIHPEYEVLCVFGRNRDLWDDLQTRFRRPGYYLIFVDDANRISSFDYVVDLLQYQSDEQQIKVVATVRDYALDKVKEASRPLGDCANIELKPFNEDQIKTLINNEYGIVNHQYLERIAEIAQGNPRLAVMSADVAKEGPLSSIHDVSALYDKYFYSIREDLKVDDTDLSSTDILKVAAIVSFFKAVDRTNDEIMSTIGVAFDITPEVFWEAAALLHELELLNMYEDEVVRISDQVLGTYLFYLAVFKEEAIDFGTLLNYFFPKYQHRLVDSINPVISAFDSENIQESMRTHIERIWARLEEEGKEEELLHLIDVFGLIKRTDTLLWLHTRIEELESSTVEKTSIAFDKSSQAIPSPSILSVIRSFAFAEEQEVRMALDLLMRYLIKRPCEIPKLLLILIDDFGFRPESYQWGYNVQHSVVDAVCRNVSNEDTLFSRFFLAIASEYLGCNFENSKMKGMVFHTCRFSLVMTPDLASLRDNIWQKLFTLYADDDLRGEVLGVLRKYIKSINRVTNSDIVKYDAKHVLTFLENRLDPSCYQHCVLIHNYLDTIERLDIEYSEGLRDQYCSGTVNLAT